MTGRLHLLRRLRGRPRDAGLMAGILVFTLLVPVLFRARLSLVRRVLARSVARRRRGPGETRRIVACVRAVQRIGRPWVRPGCLTRATTLYWFLRRAGVPVELCFGTGAPRGRFAAHCWLELDGRPFLERRDACLHFGEIFRIPAAPGTAPADDTVRAVQRSDAARVA